MFKNPGIALIFSICHPKIIENNHLNHNVVEYLERNCGKAASSFYDYMTNEDTGWFCDKKIFRTPRKESPEVLDEVLVIHFRDENHAGLFQLMFGSETF